MTWKPLKWCFCMEQELNSTSKIAIIGGGPAGCCCAYFLQNDFDVTIFDIGSPLRTLLPTGGGRCNLAHAEYDFKELAKNYPRGEKFLYSVFSKFATAETIDMFNEMGVKTYSQPDGRIFPETNSSVDVREKFLKNLKKVKFLKETVTKLDFEKFDVYVLATGGHASFKLAEGHKIVSPKPALVGLKTVEKLPQGVSLKSVKSCGFCDDILFTHEGISGPLIYKISSVNARCEFPYKLNFDFCEDFDFQEKLNSNPHKSIKNLLGDFVPKSFAEYILNAINIDCDTKCHLINGKLRDLIIENLHNMSLTVTGTSKDGEVVTCGGVSLDEVDAKTMQSKLNQNLYFCGEILDIDGFCGGFNLQNCWSTAYVAAKGILSRKKA